MLRQNYPIQDQVQLNRLLQNSWFFFDISLKSLAIYAVQFKRFQQQQARQVDASTTVANSHITHLDLQANIEFYESLKGFTDLLAELMLKYASQTTLSKDNEFLAAYRCCNRSLANFFKVTLFYLYSISRIHFFDFRNRFLFLFFFWL